MSADRVGPAFRAVRLRRGWTQTELARRAGISRWAVSQAENGRLERLAFETLEKLARALDAQLDLRVRWRGDEVDRLLNREHSGMHEQMARLLGDLPGWESAPEVSFA